MITEQPIVYVVDDDASVRKAALRLFKSVDIRAQAFPSASEFLIHELSDGPCCLVLDVRMPGLSGLQVQQALEEDRVDIPIVFLTGHGDIPMAVEAVKKGAVDFLTKPFDDQKLLDAVQLALTKHVQSRQLASMNAQLRARLDSLTERERQVLELIVQGLLNKQIAKALTISEVTVKSHRARVMEKMQVESLAELVRIVERISPSDVDGC